MVKSRDRLIAGALERVREPARSFCSSAASRIDIFITGYHAVGEECFYRFSASRQARLIARVARIFPEVPN
jgi:hypothetical protein